MSSAAQHLANIANAQLSTGPRTPEGKARVSQNALRHGLTAKHLVIRPEDQEEFAALRDGLTAELDPQGPVETVTFLELLHAAWNLARFRRIEAELSTGSAEDFSDPARAAAADRLSRYQARAQRAWYRALEELRTLQTNRALRGIKLNPEIEPEIPAIAAINDLTKQTRSEVAAEALEHAFRMVEYDTAAYLYANRSDIHGPRPGA
jgi:hypothetical protein